MNILVKIHKEKINVTRKETVSPLNTKKVHIYLLRVKKLHKL